MAVSHCTKLSIIEILPCTESMVVDHYKSIAHLVSDSSRSKFKAGMYKAVEEGTAYYVPDQDCFLYFQYATPTKIKGVAFKGSKNPSVTLQLLCGIFAETNVQEAIFIPHESTDVSQYRSLTGNSGRNGIYKINVKRILYAVKKTNLKVPNVKSSKDC